MTRLISSIYDQGEPPRRTPQEIEAAHHALRKRIWHALGIATIDPADVNCDFTRQAIINECNRQYGHRRRA